MPPQNSNQQEQYPVDYLNQISSQPQKSGLTNNKFFLLLGGLLVGVVIIAIILLALAGAAGGPKEKMQILAARLQSLQTIASDAQKTIKSGQLRTTNSNLTIFLTNANRDIAEPLAEVDIDVSKLDEEIVAQESGEELAATLEDARLNAVYDRTYAREMSYQLDKLSVLIREIYNATNNTAFKTFLENTNTNLESLREQFSEFNATTG